MSVADIFFRPLLRWQNPFCFNRVGEKLCGEYNPGIDAYAELDVWLFEWRTTDNIFVFNEDGGCEDCYYSYFVVFMKEFSIQVCFYFRFAKPQ
jgi:hypothetical protein